MPPRAEPSLNILSSISAQADVVVQMLCYHWEVKLTSAGISPGLDGHTGMGMDSYGLQKVPFPTYLSSSPCQQVWLESFELVIWTEDLHCHGVVLNAQKGYGCYWILVLFGFDWPLGFLVSFMHDLSCIFLACIQASLGTQMLYVVRVVGLLTPIILLPTPSSTGGASGTAMKIREGDRKDDLRPYGKAASTKMDPHHCNPGTPPPPVRPTTASGSKAGWSSRTLWFLWGDSGRPAEVFPHPVVPTRR